MKQGLLQLKEFIADNAEHIVVLADKHTLDDCYPLLDADVLHFTVPYGEVYKNLNSCEYIWKKLTELNATRQTILLCLGGGVLCDIGAFAGACYQRGMRVVLAPTSLLAMVDASTGGKTGVNFLGFKNYIGLFATAEQTFICPEFLDTLPYEERVNGYVEMLKHGLIADKEHYDIVKMLFLKENEKLNTSLIFDSIAIKQKHVEQDFKDEGIRKRLNFGHTIGHAIESHSLHINDENESLSHGVSVAIGMLGESYISTKVAGLSAEENHEINLVLQRLLSSLEEDIPSIDELLPYLQKDKKNDGEGINFSLLKTIGDCKQDYTVSVDLIKESLDYIRKLK
ncbi:MAG: 3-dehydroquinate synthase [Bacteroidia bacterium]